MVKSPATYLICLLFKIEPKDMHNQATTTVSIHTPRYFSSWHCVTIIEVIYIFCLVQASTSIVICRNDIFTKTVKYKKNTAHNIGCQNRLLLLWLEKIRADPIKSNLNWTPKLMKLTDDIIWYVIWMQCVVYILC